MLTVKRAISRKRLPRAKNNSRRIVKAYEARLIMDAQCTRCGPMALNQHSYDSVTMLAKRHTAATGHLVILNGTTDAPDMEFKERMAN